jgi:demethylmenaquinone methyltransferase/2-methoxy-6-polyprenyl-1,4-benzoquinol methylase
MDLEEHLDDPSKKQRYVTAMFDIIAPKYDGVTRLLSLGMDQAWKKELLERVRPKVGPDGIALDLASGTGDLAFAVSRLVPRGRVIGIDLSAEMVKIAKRRAERQGLTNVEFRLGDLTELGLPDESVDLVTIGYGLRNVPDFRAALARIARVLKPGGVFANLDFARPRNRLWRSLYLGYLALTGNLAGFLIHGEGAVYGYIARSIEKFVSWQELSTEIEDRGFDIVATSPKLAGGICLHVATKSKKKGSGAAGGGSATHFVPE